MAGVNTFIDHDLSRSHTRIGVGAEYWRDYLKLSANGYIRASGWKKCKRAARTVLTGMCYSVGSATRQGSSSPTRFIGQSAMTSRT
ncbi:attaching and effacing protein, pathogenesis factor [Escherichia coli]|uniref:Attaching and effacing protein, pathogenesis factor n=1 Tax=Escherichia coli TaxID=562 RepID=A0A376RNA7_ECOLX|nr:attaching and effacing protein, pathogenesis factor [Escherichia coli]